MARKSLRTVKTHSVIFDALDGWETVDLPGYRELSALLDEEIGETHDDRLATKEAAIAYGRRTGLCAVCLRPLTSPDSRAKGIGPTCLKTFGKVKGRG